jgi:hypothetical protein
VLSHENEEIADWLERLTKNKRTCGFRIAASRAQRSIFNLFDCVQTATANVSAGHALFGLLNSS